MKKIHVFWFVQKSTLHVQSLAFLRAKYLSLRAPYPALCLRGGGKQREPGPLRPEDRTFQRSGLGLQRWRWGVLLRLLLFLGAGWPFCVKATFIVLFKQDLYLPPQGEANQ